jgi:hypothetical protein
MKDFLAALLLMPAGAIFVGLSSLLWKLCNWLGWLPPYDDDGKMVLFLFIEFVILVFSILVWIGIMIGVEELFFPSKSDVVQFTSDSSSGNNSRDLDHGQCYFHEQGCNCSGDGRAHCDNR